MAKRIETEAEKQINDKLRQHFYREPQHGPRESGWTVAQQEQAAKNRDAMLRDPAPVHDNRVFLHSDHAELLYRQRQINIANRNERLARESQLALHDLLHAQDPAEEARLQAAIEEWCGEINTTERPLLIYSKAVPATEIPALQAKVAKIVDADAKRRESCYVPRCVLQLIVCQNPANGRYEYANNGFAANNNRSIWGRVDCSRPVVRQIGETETENLYDGEQLVALICPGNFYVDRINFRAIDLLERDMIALHDKSWKKYQAARDNR